MNRLLLNDTFRRLARTATFVVAAAAILEPTPLPPGSSSIDLPLVSSGTNRTVVARPPLDESAAPPESLPEGQQRVVPYRPPYLGRSYAISGEINQATPDGGIHLDIPLVSQRPNRTAVKVQQLEETVAESPPEGKIAVQKGGAPYRGPTSVVFRQPDEIDELLQGRRITIGYRQAYNTRLSQVSLPQVAENPVLEADELTVNRRLVIPYKRPYPLTTTVVLPQIPENEPSVYLPEGSSSLTLPQVEYRQRHTKLVRPDISVENVPEADLTLLLPTEYEIRSRNVTAGVPPAEQVVNEADELTNKRRAILGYKRPYPLTTRVVTPQIPEPEPSVYLPEGSSAFTLSVVQYRQLHTRVVRPDISTENVPEADLTLLLPTEYEIRAKTIVVQKTPEDPIIDPVDETMVARRSIWRPKPQDFLRPNLTRVTTPPIAEPPAVTIRNLPLLGVG